MTHKIREARTLCTADEFELFRDSLPGHLYGLSFPELQSCLLRARTLRDKYQDVHRRQRGGARGKLTHGRPKELYDCTRTGQKADLFAKALGRFERKVRTLEEQDRRREEEARLRTSGERRRVDQDCRRLKAERADRESHLTPPTADAGPRAPVGAPPPRPAWAMRNALAKSAAGHFRSANRRFQARRDRQR